jgi:hypothetical protein
MQGHGSNSIFDFQQEMIKQINMCKKIGYEATQKALKASGEEMVKRASEATNTNGLGIFKASWKLAPYPNSIYIYNSRGVLGPDKGIPLSNLSEYSARGPHPFILSTFERSKQALFNAFKNEMNKNIRRN